MKKNNVKNKLDQGQRACGTFLWSASGSIVECLGFTGLDYVIIDAEHTPIDTEGAINLVHTAKLRGLTPFVRAKELSRSSVLKMLDIGAEALIVPYLKTVDDVKRLVEWGKYMPVGERGFMPSRDSGWGFDEYGGDLKRYFAVSNEQTLLLPMCETAELFSCIEEVVSLDGVDGIYVGPYDLSLTLGMPGDFDNPEFRKKLAHIAQVCREHHKYSFIFSSTPARAVEHFSLGYQA